MKKSDGGTPDSPEQQEGLVGLSPLEIRRVINAAHAAGYAAGKAFYGNPKDKMLSNIFDTPRENTLGDVVGRVGMGQSLDISALLVALRGIQGESHDGVEIITQFRQALNITEILRKIKIQQSARDNRRKPSPLQFGFDDDGRLLENINDFTLGKNIPETGGETILPWPPGSDVVPDIPSVGDKGYIDTSRMMDDRKRNQIDLPLKPEEEFLIIKEIDPKKPK